MDCPGLYDTKKTQEEISTVIVQAVACMHPGPHAVLYVVKIDRYTAEEYGAYQRLKALFDDTITDYIIVVFTGGDELEKKKKTFEDLMKNAPEHLKIVLKECGNRCIVFNNFAPDPQPQIDRLFEVIRQMKHANGKPYSCPKYEEIGESVEQEVARRLAVVDKKELERQKYVQELQKKTEAAEEEVRKQKEENEKKEQERQRQLEEEVKKRKEEVEKLKKQLEEQKMSEERKIQEVRTLQKHLERERQQFLLQLEEQRRKDREEMERREEKRAELEEKRREEEIEAMERERLRYEKELNSLKDMIAEEKEPGFIGKSVRFVSAPVRYVYNALEKL
nr:hypothetical protein BaRGS_002986 [Batillaria attramentaria]